MKQSRIQSATEASLNTFSGFLLSWALWPLFITPVFSYHPKVGESFAITCVYTVASLFRSYVWRRGFNWWHHRRHS